MAAAYAHMIVDAKQQGYRALTAQQPASARLAIDTLEPVTIG